MGWLFDEQSGEEQARLTLTNWTSSSDSPASNLRKLHLVVPITKASLGRRRRSLFMSNALLSC